MAALASLGLRTIRSSFELSCPSGNHVQLTTSRDGYWTQDGPFLIECGIFQFHILEPWGSVVGVYYLYVVVW
jgi:hypothetical protein